MRRGFAAAALATLVAAGACTEEGPTEVGGGLVSGGELRTFEVTLDAGQFLAVDTAFAGYSSPVSAGYQIVANAFAGVLDAHALTRFVDLPDSAQVQQSDGTLRWDRDLTYLGGELTLVMDTVRSAAEGEVALRVHRILQAWDPGSATWTMAVDSGAVDVPWIEAGGTRTAPLSSAPWSQGQDSVTLPLDSTAVRALEATPTREAGLLVSMAGGQGRLRISSMTLHVQVRAASRPDSIIRILVPVSRRTFVYTPELAPAAASPRVGGIEGWRTFLRFGTGLSDRQVSCVVPGVPGPCTVALGNAVLNRAELILHPEPPPPGYAPLDSVPVTASSVLTPAFVPLARSPLFQAVGGLGNVDPAVFLPDSDSTLALDITEFIRPLVYPGAGSEEPTPWLALVSVPEGLRFGIGAFSGTPRLRLILTVASEVQLR